MKRPWPRRCETGQVAAAALDVFEIEPLPPDSPLRGAPNLVLTPHLGASTVEAQESVGIEIAQSIRAVLLEGTIRNAVNMPNLDAKTLAIVGPHLRFGEKLGTLSVADCAETRRVVNINYSGKVNEVDTTAITRAALKGFLQIAGGSEINEVNAPAFAETLGLKVTRITAECRQAITLTCSNFPPLAKAERFQWVALLRGHAANCEHQQPTGRSPAAGCGARPGKHGSSRNGRADRHTARRTRRQHRDDVTQSKSGRRHRAHRVESRHRPE